MVSHPYEQAGAFSDNFYVQKNDDIDCTHKVSHPCEYADDLSDDFFAQSISCIAGIQKVSHLNGHTSVFSDRFFAQNIYYIDCTCEAYPYGSVNAPPGCQIAQRLLNRADTDVFR